jgi:lysophospholipid acyltransferase (LPLAT)-like uncharacterized protein
MADLLDSSAAPFPRNDPRATGAAMFKRVMRSEAMQAALAWLLGFYLAFALRTTRWHLDGREYVAPYAAGATVIAAFWHERLPLMPALWLSVRRMGAAAAMHVLVSHHRDGRLIGLVLRRFRADVVHGSSSRGGAAAIKRMLYLIGAGDLVAITPDGPRGPRREAAPGVAQLAALSGTPVLPCAAQTSRRWVLRSWDRMVIPKPFGRGVLVCGPIITVPRKEWERAVPAIKAALDAAAERADQLCAA